MTNDTFLIYTKGTRKPESAGVAIISPRSGLSCLMPVSWERVANCYYGYHVFLLLFDDVGEKEMMCTNEQSLRLRLSSPSYYFLERYFSRYFLCILVFFCMNIFISTIYVLFTNHFFFCNTITSARWDV